MNMERDPDWPSPDELDDFRKEGLGGVMDIAIFVASIAIIAFMAVRSNAAITPPPVPPTVIVEPDLPTPEEREAQRRKARARRELNKALNATIADTRTNIVETAELSDEQIAGLYLKQMKRDVSPLVGRVPTNTVEYLIGAGMRIDIAEGDTNTVPANAPMPSEDEE